MTPKQIETLIVLFFIHSGRFPAGTDDTNWEQVTIGDLQLDDPPLPGMPDYEHKKYAELLLLDLNKMSLKVPGLTKQFSNDNLTMRELVDYCVDNAKPYTKVWRTP